MGKRSKKILGNVLSGVMAGKIEEAKRVLAESEEILKKSYVSPGLSL